MVNFATSKLGFPTPNLNNNGQQLSYEYNILGYIILNPSIFGETRFVAPYFQQMILYSKIFEIIDTNNSLYSIFLE